jgi:hypothetical protein
MSNLNDCGKEKILEHVSETMLHKSFVIQACLKMARYLKNNGEEDLALFILRRSNIHDNSKLIGPELELLASLYGNQESFVNPTVQLSDSQREIIEMHWENNRHHPEHFDEILKMSELDIIEMCCDWYARSLQYGTDFIDFIKTRQETRFHFPDDMFEKILKYCEILNSPEV